MYDFRFCLFKKKQKQSEILLPTPDALREGILLAHYQMLIWNKDTVPNPTLPSPAGHGWKMEGREWIPTLANQLPALLAVIHLVNCH